MIRSIQGVHLISRMCKVVLTGRRHFFRRRANPNRMAMWSLTFGVSFSPWLWSSLLYRVIKVCASCPYGVLGCFARHSRGRVGMPSCFAQDQIFPNNLASSPARPISCSKQAASNCFKRGSGCPSSAATGTHRRAVRWA